MKIATRPISLSMIWRRKEKTFVQVFKLLFGFFFCFRELG